MCTDTDRPFEKLAKMRVPTKRATYSDRMAWMMALLADIVYERSEEESDDALVSMAEELAGLAFRKDVDAKTIKDRLQELALTLANVGRRDRIANNEILKAALAAGWFYLVGESPIHIPETDTQEMVVRRKATKTEQAFVVLCFWGTQQVRDWLTISRLRQSQSSTQRRVTAGSATCTKEFMQPSNTRKSQSASGSRWKTGRICLYTSPAIHSAVHWQLWRVDT